MNDTTIKWEGAGTKLPSGHTIFETHDNGHGETGWAIADESGDLPHLTDDGILWLDVSRCLHVSSEFAPIVPLVGENGERTRTPVDAPTILFLSKMFKWTIADDERGNFYNVR